MCKEFVQDLAKAVISSVNPTSYGRIRTKLNKQGFSEIAIYTAITQHCIDNDIKPQRMAKETLAYLEGCALNMYHPKASNDFHFLRGQFHKIRHGNPEKGEPKSPEQKGSFLCNRCCLILSEKLRSTGKNEKHLCSSCKSEKSKEAYRKKKQEEKTAKPVVEPQPVVLSTSNSGFKHEEVASQLSEALSSLPETEKSVFEPTPEPTTEPQKEQEEMPETKEAPEVIEEQDKFGENVKITEVIADESNATISLQCPTESLHLILAAIKSL